MADETAKVITFVGELRRERTVFEGLPEDAETYLRNTFPRPHIEPGTDYGEDGPPADACIQYADDSRKFWDGRQLLEWHPPATAANPSNANRTNTAELQAAQAEIERLQQQLADFQRQQQLQQSAPPPAEQSGGGAS